MRDNSYGHQLKVLLVLVIVSAVVQAALWRLLYPLDYYDLSAPHAVRCGFDPLLIAAVMRAESGFDPRAVSPRGAVGLMQLMPETASWVARQLGMGEVTRDDLFDPSINVQLGIWYLAHLRDSFGGDLVLTLAAYNAGQTRVRRWVSQRDEELVEAEDLPWSETRRYVRQVLDDYVIYRRLYRSVPWPPGRRGT